MEPVTVPAPAAFVTGIVVAINGVAVASGVDPLAVAAPVAVVAGVDAVPLTVGGTVVEAVVAAIVGVGGVTAKVSVRIYIATSNA